MDEPPKLMGFVYKALEVTKKIRKEDSGLYRDIFNEKEAMDEENLITFYTQKFKDYQGTSEDILNWLEIPRIIKPFVEKKRKLFNTLLLNKKYIDHSTKIFKNPFSMQDEPFQKKEDVMKNIKDHIESYVKQQVEQFLSSEWSDKNELNLEDLDVVEKDVTTPISDPIDPKNLPISKPDDPPEIPLNHVHQSTSGKDSGFESSMDVEGDSNKRPFPDSEQQTSDPDDESSKADIFSNGLNQSFPQPKRAKTDQERDKASYYLAEGNVNLPNTILAYYYLKMRDYVRVMRRMANYARVSRGDEDEIARIEFKTTPDNKLVEKIHHTYSSNQENSKQRYVTIKKLLRADDIRVMEGVQELQPEEAEDFSETNLYRKPDPKNNRWIKIVS